MLEKDVERKVCQHAAKHGWWPLKLSIIAMSGFPDRLFLGPGANIFFVEFKAPGKTATKLQEHIMGKLNELGFRTYVIDSIEDGKRIIQDEAARLPKPGR